MKEPAFRVTVFLVRQEEQEEEQGKQEGRHEKIHFLDTGKI